MELDSEEQSCGKASNVLALRGGNEQGPGTILTREQDHLSNSIGLKDTALDAHVAQDGDPLRDRTPLERGDDCHENAKPLRHFTPAAMKLLMDYDWPGNVRELENVVERAVVLSTQERVDVDLLPESIRSKEIVRGVRLQLSEFLPPLPGEPGSRAAADHPQPSLFQIMDEIERRIIIDMLERTGWNQTEAAERFMIPLSTLNQKIKRLGIDVRRRGRGDEMMSASMGK